MKKHITWDGIVSAALKMPGVKVDRAAFLRKAFAPYGDYGGILDDKRPDEVFSADAIHHTAKKVIKNHTAIATMISTAAGVPGGFALFGTVPGDIVQFYWNLFVLSQKLAYIYGWPDFRDEEGELGEGARRLLTLFVGVAMGEKSASRQVMEIVEKLARHWRNALPLIYTDSETGYPIVQKVAAIIMLKSAKASVGKTFGKVLPVVGGVVSGALTFNTFKPMAARLDALLMASNETFANADGSEPEKTDGLT